MLKIEFLTCNLSAIVTIFLILKCLKIMQKMQIVDWLNVIYLMFFFVKFVMHVMNYNIHYYNINANCVKLTGYRYISDKNDY